MSSHKPIVTGLLSYGMSGEVFHAPFLISNPGFHLKYVLQRTGNKVQQYYPEVGVVRSIDAIIHDPEIELVVVNTPPDTHFDFAYKALEANKHVVVEKPFTSTSAEASELIALSKKQNKILSVFHSRRWDGAFITLQKIINDGSLGGIVEYEARYDRFRPAVVPNSWKEERRPGSGILFNLGSHMIDQALVLFGKPQSVSARIGIQRPNGKIDDFYDLRLTYEGLNVIIKSSYVVAEPSRLYSVNGLNGSFVKYGIDPQEEALKRHEIPDSPGWGEEPKEYWGKLTTEVNGVRQEKVVETIPGFLSGFYKNIFDAIRGGQPLAVKPEEAMQVIQLIEASMKSNTERCNVSY